MLEDIKAMAGKHWPPSVMVIGLSAMIFGYPSQTQLNWPMVGEFVLDPVLKALAIALVWFLVLSGWGLVRRLNKSWFFSAETKAATIRAREMIRLDRDYIIKSGLDEVKITVEKRLQYMEEVTSFTSMLESEKAELLFLNGINRNKDNYQKCIIEFLELTKWVKT